MNPTLLYGLYLLGFLRVCPIGCPIWKTGPKHQIYLVLYSPKRRKPNRPFLKKYITKFFKIFSMLGGTILSLRDVAVHVNVPLHKRRYKCCSTWRTLFKDSFCQKVLTLNGLRGRNTKFHHLRLIFNY